MPRGSWISASTSSSAPWSAPSCCWWSSTADQFVDEPGRPDVAGPVGRRVLRRPDAGRPRGLWYVPRHKLPTWRWPTSFAPGIALGHVVGRLGCFLAGCCYGRPTDVPWAVMFTNPLAARERRHAARRAPASDAVVRSRSRSLILALLLAFEGKGRPFPGRTFWGYMLVYGASRFVIEIYRGDPRGMVFGDVSDLAVHLAAHRAAQRVHAVPPVAAGVSPPRCDTSATRPARACVKATCP
jgi:hypothetical protein